MKVERMNLRLRMRIRSIQCQSHRSITWSNQSDFETFHKIMGIAITSVYIYIYKSSYEEYIYQGYQGYHQGY